MKRTILAGGLSLLFFSNILFAQCFGPSANAVNTTIKKLNKIKDDQKIILKGHILTKVGHEKYIFTDGTGEIRVEIDNEIFPQVPITEESKLEIYGEIEKDFLQSPEIDVNYLKVIK